MFATRKFAQIFTSFIVIVTLVVNTMNSSPVLAQGKDGIKRQMNADSGRVSFIGPESGRAVAASQALGIAPGGPRPADPALALAKRFAPEFGLTNPGRDLAEMKKNRLDNGRITARYQQNYQGIPVLAGELIVNTNDNGDLYSMSGEVSPNLSLPTQPNVDSERARQTALKAMQKWYAETPTQFVISDPELWIFDERLIAPSTRPPELVWRMEATSADNNIPVRELILINAQTGKLSLHFNQIDTAWHVSKTKPAQGALQEGTSTETPVPTDTPPATETPIPNVGITPVPMGAAQSTDVASGQSSTGDVVILAGTTYYVATTGNDLNTCTSTGSPCATIQGAIGKAADGDTIKIATGTYTGTGSEVAFVNISLTLSGGWDSTFTTQTGYATIDGQNARRGVTIWSSSVTTVMERFTVLNGSSSEGAGVKNYGGNLTLTNSFIHNNISSGSGGGINNYGGIMTLNNSTVSNNSAPALPGFSGAGGGISNDSNGTLTVNNSTVSGNSAGWGGGIYNWYNTNLILNNVTVSNNSASYSLGGGGIYNDGSVSLQNTVLGGNTASTGTDCAGSVSSSFISGGYNIISNTSGCSMTSTSGDQFDVNPMLGTFLPVQGYHPLVAGSPAINAGNAATCLPTDQRGMARVGTCDIGSYEYSTPGAAASIWLISGSGQRAAQNSVFSKPLQAVILDSQGRPVSGVSVTFTAPASGASGTFAATGTNTTSVNTDGGGSATTSAFTANGQLGSYLVSASASGTGSVNFSLANASWFVSTTGNDSNSCAAPASPCLTINGAIGKAFNGDTVKVATGTYTGTGSEVVLIDKSLTLSGGWNAGFTTANGTSTIDGQNSRRDIYVHSDTATITASLNSLTLKNGSAASGAGIYNNFGILTLNDVNVSYNSGGGIYNNAGTMTLNTTTVSTNTINGGIYGWYSTLTLNNTTVSNNSAGSGGGIYVNHGSLALNNTTISGNYATSGGGIANYGNVSLRNSILGNNTAFLLNPDCLGTLDSDGNNIVSSTLGCTVVTFLNSGDQFNVNPMLGTFLPAQGYHPLMAGSPAINAGNPATCLPTDQRGVARVGTCDSGAYEYTVPVAPASFIQLSGTPQSALMEHAFSLPLKVAVLDNVGTPVNNVTVTFTAPASGASGIFTGGTSILMIPTDGGGVAQTTFEANSIAGSYVVAATANGLGTVLNFSLTNLLVAPYLATYTANNATSLPGSFLCDQSQPACTGGVNPDADSAHAYALGTFDLYFDQHHRASLDDNGMTIVSSVHYDSGYGNAYWSGSQMIYGDGYGFANADDMVAHELTHGVTQYESNLLYIYQSGAINESLSDLWGEYFDQTNGMGTTDTADVKWLIGEDVTDLGAFRSMSNPPAFGDPDKMTSNLFYKGEADNGGVHFNSGVNNKAVYLMVDGGVFNAKTVTGIGWGKTAAIYYEVQTNLLGSGSNYSDLYYALQQACSTLTGGPQGITLDNCVNVKNALDAVQMNTSLTLKHQITAPLCPTGMVPSTTLFEDELEGLLTDNWNPSSRWSLSTSIASSPTHAIYGDDFSSALNETVEMNTGVLVQPSTYLHFDHAYDFEAYGSSYYDGGVLEYSTNGGSTWNDAGTLFSAGANYAGTINSSWGSALAGRKAFSGSSFSYYSYFYQLAYGLPSFAPSLVSSRYNLNSLTGQTVRFRFRFATDSSVEFGGWYIDDVQIYTCLGTPSVPILQIPVNSALVTTYTPKLNWADSVPVADNYQLQVSTSNTFASTVIDVPNIGISEYTVPTLNENTTYYWRVRAFNGENATNGWSLVWNFRTMLLAPELSEPGDGTSPKTLRPSFTWTNPNNDGPTPTGYTIQVAMDSQFKKIVHTGNPVSTQYVPTADLPKSSALVPALYWRVQAKGLNGPSAWSSTRSFIPPGNSLLVPTLVSPATNALTTNYTPTLSWSMTAGAIYDHFLVQVDDKQDFSNPEVNVMDSSVSTLTYTPGSALASNTRFYWRVRAVNAGGEMGNWSAVRSFRTALDVPALVAPGNGTSVDELRPMFDWDAVNGAIGYTVQISKNDTFTQIVHTGNPALSNYVPTADLPKSTVAPVLYWRVQSKGANGPSAWSSTHSFIPPVNPPPVPTLVAPAANALTTDFTPALSWSMPAGAVFDHFIIQVDNDQDFSSLVYENLNVGSAPVSLSPDLAANKTYYWRVRAVNGSGEMSNWSALRSFRTALDVPILGTPGDGTNVYMLRPTFDWDNVNGATGYTIQIATDNQFTKIVHTGNPAGSQYIPTTDLPKGTVLIPVLYWRVQAKGLNGPSAWSLTRSFTPPTNPPPAPTLVAPAANTLTTDFTPTLSWSMAAGAVYDHFLVQVDNNADFSSPEMDVVDNSVTTLNFTPPSNLASNSKLYWRVRAVNGSGEMGNWSTSRYFRTLLEAPALISPYDTASISTSYPVFNWDNVPGASGYIIQVSTTSSFTVNLVNANTVQSIYSPLIALPKGVFLYWRVRATGTNGLSAWTTYTFTVMP